MKSVKHGIDGGALILMMFGACEPGDEHDKQGNEGSFHGSYLS